MKNGSTKDQLKPALEEVLRQAMRRARRVVIFVIGWTIVAIGVVLIVAPGPAFVVIPAGFGVLALEFAWARRWLNRLKDLMGSLAKGAKGEKK